MIKASKSLQTRYDSIYTYEKYYVKTHSHVFLFCVKKTRVWIIASLTLNMTWRGNAMLFIGPTFQKIGGYGYYEWVENESCRFGEDISWQTHCTYKVNDMYFWKQLRIQIFIFSVCTSIKRVPIGANGNARKRDHLGRFYRWASSLCLNAFTDEAVTTNVVGHSTGSLPFVWR